MHVLRRSILIGSVTVAVWLLACGFVGIIAANWALHPMRHPVSPQMEAEARALADRDHATLETVAISADDGVTLRAWRMNPEHRNGNAVILFHGVSDNRAGMLGPADFLLRSGYFVLLPDARAHGSSGGPIATYGVTESGDIRDWFQWIVSAKAPRCVYAIGESMGAAQLLDSLNVEPGFCAVVAESPFANFREASFIRLGQQLGVGDWAGRTLLRPAVETALLYVRWRYHVDLSQDQPDRAVARSRVPVLLIHGMLDRNLPPRNSEMILARNHGRNPNVVLWEPRDADHCGAATAEPREYQRRVLEWFGNHGPTQALQARR